MEVANDYERFVSLDLLVHLENDKLVFLDSVFNVLKMDVN